jgi:hypothetical protein
MTQQQQQYQTRDNSGTLFKNDRKTEDKHPNMKGKALIGGRWYWVSAWTKEGKQGRFQSLAFEEMTDEQADKYGGHQSGSASANGSRDSAAPNRQRPPPQRQQKTEDSPFGDNQKFEDADIPF